MTGRSPDELLRLVEQLRALPHECEWVEFKVGNADPTRIGEYLSALSNSATLSNRSGGYLVWGIRDDTHEVTGTTFEPKKKKKGNEDLESWLLQSLQPKIQICFHELEVEGKRVVLLEADRAHREPTQFRNDAYVRVGSYTKKLSAFPEKARALWGLFEQTPFERGFATHGLTQDEILGLLDVRAYYELQRVPVPRTPSQQLERMAVDEMLECEGAGSWRITNLGALLFARRLADFPSVRRKAVRVVAYHGRSRVDAAQEALEPAGYAVCFEELIGRIARILPPNEVLGQAIRGDVPLYPEPAIRELAANALIHQDLAISGSGPMVEVFTDRMEIANPGIPLVDTRRWLDSPPRSRNEHLASFMRRIGVCEERGSGVDKVVFQTELYQLPAPVFEQAGAEGTRAVLFAPKPLRQMHRAERVRACYLHACLKWVGRDYLTNGSIRARFGIGDASSSQASRYIKEALDAGEIRADDPGAPPKLMRYLPFWA